MSIHEMIDLFEKKVDWISKNKKEKTKLYGAKLMLKYYQMLQEGLEQGKPIAWISLAFPVEILYAMDIMPLCTEQYAIQTVVSSNRYDLLDKGFSIGFNQEGCSNHPATIGMALENLMPPPDLLLCSGPSPCDSSNMMFEVLSDMYSKPVFYLNHPYDPDENTLKHYLSELESMVAFLRKTTGHDLDEDKLRALLENSQKITRYLRLTHHQLRKKVPCPMPSRLAQDGWGYRVTCEGLPETVEYFRVEYEEIKERADRGEGVVPEEKFRVIMNGAYPFWDMKLFDYMEEKYGAVVVCDWNNMFDYLATPDDLSDPLKALAIKNQAGTTIEFNTFPRVLGEAIPRVGKETKVNASIFFAALGCIVNTGYIKQAIDIIKEELGVPTAIIDTDVLNPTVVSRSQMRAVVDEYFQMLGAEKPLGAPVVSHLGSGEEEGVDMVSPR